MNAECLHLGPNKVKQSVFVIFFSLLPHPCVLIDGLLVRVQTSCICLEGYSGDGRNCEMVNLCEKVSFCPYLWHMHQVVSSIRGRIRSIMIRGSNGAAAAVLRLMRQQNIRAFVVSEKRRLQRQRQVQHVCPWSAKLHLFQWLRGRWLHLQRHCGKGEHAPHTAVS